MSNLKISGLALVLGIALSSTTAAATTRNGTATTCYTTNISNFKHTTKTCRTVKRKVQQAPSFFSWLQQPEPAPVKRVTQKRKKVTEPVVASTSDTPAPLSSRSDILSEAKRYIGMTERGHTKSLTALTGVNPRRTPWCAAFVNAILNKKGYKTSGSLMAASFSSYGHKVLVPLKGDIVVLRNKRGNHVGIFVEYKTINGRKMIGVLGGNQNNMVKVTYYSARSVVTIRRPTA
jgi:uncharacterized protein (TIGR02594 family)